MPLPFQPVRLRYGYAASGGDSVQPIPSIDPSEGGNGLFVYFNQDLDDPAHHHSNSGGVSFVWGPSIGASRALVSGTVSLWIRDLWAPEGWGGYRTEIQGFLTKAKTSDYSMINTRSELFATEKYAPPQNDDLVWDAAGNVSHNEPGHVTVTKHVAFHWHLEEVLSTECMRFNIGQMHRRNANGEFLVPGYDKPWPGHVWRAQLRAEIWPV